MQETAATNSGKKCSMRRTIVTCLMAVVVLSADLLTSAESPEFALRDARQNEFARDLANYEVVTPAKVDQSGAHLSHHVTHHLPPHNKHRQRRSAAFWEEEGGDHGENDSRLHYKITVDGEELHLELTPNDYLFAPGLVVERRRRSTTRRGTAPSHGDARVERIAHNKCHFAGKVKGRPESTVAIATCDGLHGYIHTGEKDYFIEPVKGYNQSQYVGHPHLIYRRSALPSHLLPSHDDDDSMKSRKEEGTCGVTDENPVPAAVDAERATESGGGGGGGGGGGEARSIRRRRKRSISLERNVETLVVVDKNMMEYHRNENIENYVLTIMNMVATMYHDATIGNAINIVLVRIIYLEQDEKDLVIQTHADHTLSSFCKWQASINQKGDKHPNHHDVAILLTRLDICSRSTEPCSTLGLSQVSGMCQDHRSCNINQDTGLALAFTVTHELGHNFGMQHDTAENGCEPRVHWLQYIMAPQLTAEASPLVWSNCSRKAVTAFLDRDWGYCLEDEPSDHEFDFPVLPPGVMYDIDHQCRLQYGPEAGYCEGIDDLCATVWCRVENKCLTRLEAAAEGTLCGDNEWCYGGRCIAIGEKPLAIDSHWGEWGSWSECSRSCGAGVSHSERLCNNPPPSHGGRYCLGERKRFRICNTQLCREGSPSFREHQCAEFNNVVYKGHRYQWEPVTTPSTPCQLHCKPRGRYISVMLKDVVTDGTPCKTGRRDMCISGRCRVVGCDWGIESDAVEDVCGMCHGDGTTCTKVTESFDKKSGLGYVEATIIPEGARNIRVEEVAEANNYLAIRNDKGTYYLNGDWYIQWSGDYEVAGTVLEYRREGNKESIFTIGPIKEPLHLMLLFQSQNPGIKFEYTVLNENATDKRRPEFHWKYADWTHCTASCGGGSQTSQVVCVEKEAGIVEEKFCNISIKPDDMHKPCNDHQCPARWWHGLWQHCSVSCGGNGHRRRTVLCVRQLGPDEQIALEDWECESLENKPLEISECSHKEPCPVEDTVWKVGPWSEVCRNDPCARQNRTVECINNFGYCDLSKKPSTEKPCPQALCGQWKTTQWSKCTQMCGGGFQFRTVTCVGGRACPHLKPPDEQQCNEQSCSSPQDAAETSLLPSSSSHTDSSSSISSKLDGILEDVLTSRHSPNESTWQTMPKVDHTEFNSSSSLAMVTMALPSTRKPETQISGYRWVALFWSECSKLCGKGYMTRRVMCMRIDAETRDTVRDELCDIQKKPLDKDTCQMEPCITWTVTAWQSCSVTCGEGLQQRMVSCALENLCDPDERPADKMICNLGSCTRWIVGQWQECSQSCGSGTQQRNVTCINSATQQAANECDPAMRPMSAQTCNIAQCPSISAVVNDQAEPCSRNFFTDGICAALRNKGSCSLSYVQRKCCKTCHRSTHLSKPKGES